MDIRQAIERLQSLPPDRQARLIRLIETETATETPRAHPPESEQYGWMKFAIEHPIDLGRSDMSEHPSVFAGRAPEE